MIGAVGADKFIDVGGASCIITRLVEVGAGLDVAIDVTDAAPAAALVELLELLGGGGGGGHSCRWSRCRHFKACPLSPSLPPTVANCYAVVKTVPKPIVAVDPLVVCLGRARQPLFQ